MGESKNRPKVLLLGEIEHAHAAWRALAELAELIEPESKCRAGFLNECKSGAFDGVVVTYRTFASIDITGLFDEEVIKVLPDSLKFVCHNGAGYDQVDVHACTARGISVSNTPTAVDDATADINMFLILGALRGFYAGMAALREGKWRGSPIPPPLGHDPQGKVLGILGMGGIGRNLRSKAEAFGMKVIYHNRSQLRKELEGNAEYVDFDELLARSDVLSLNLPLNLTKHIISTREFAKMKKGVVIVNTARGAVMDEDALVHALDSGRVLTCGLDVYEDEPKIHPGLVANPHVMLVPHMGTWTVETQTKMEEWNIANVRAALERGELISIVPEQADLRL